MTSYCKIQLWTLTLAVFLPPSWSSSTASHFNLRRIRYDENASLPVGRKALTGVDGRILHRTMGRIRRAAGESAPGGQCRLNPVAAELHQKLVSMRSTSSGVSADLGSSTSNKERQLSIHLANYYVSFPEYPADDSPLLARLDNVTILYRPHNWTRVFSRIGKLIATSGLPFNSAALSLGTLSVGWKQLGDVGLVDVPPGCLGESDWSTAAAVIRRQAVVVDLLTRDLDAENLLSSKTGFRPDVDFVCQQIITRADENDTIHFGHRCCTRTSGNNVVRCVDVERLHVIHVLYTVLLTIKVVFFVFGPLCLRHLLFYDASRRQEYVVNLKSDLRKTVFVRNLSPSDLVTTSPLNGSAHAHQIMASETGNDGSMRRFRTLVRRMRPGSVVTVFFRQLHLFVDHRELVSERSLPAGLMRFLYDTLFRCRPVTEGGGSEPLRSCCSEGVLGTWSPNFLWLRLLRHSDCNRGCRECCPWSRLFHFVGGVLFVAALPIPFYFRLLAYYLSEVDEMEDRRAAVDVLGEVGWKHLTASSSPELWYNVVQWLGPTHPAFVGVYLAYIAATVLLIALRSCDKDRVDAVTNGCVTDMREIRHSEIARMIAAHLVLPFEKFGLIVGLLVAVFYWPFVLPLCTAVAAVYCLPLLYVTGRLLIADRPTFLTGSHRSTPSSQFGQQHQQTISNGVTTLGSLLFIESISSSSQRRRHRAGSCCRKRNATTSGNVIHSPGAKRRHVTDWFFRLVVGVMSVIFVWTLMLMYAESVGFAVEVCLLTLLGVIVNVGQSFFPVYLVLVMWFIVYVVGVHRTLLADYADVSKRIFRHLRDELRQKPVSTSRSATSGHNVAYRFETELVDDRLHASLGADDAELPVESSDDGNCSHRSTVGPSRSSVDGDRTVGADASGSKLTGRRRQIRDDRTLRSAPVITETDLTETLPTCSRRPAEDSLTYINGKLHWTVSSLVLFVDSCGVARIPKQFFWAVCDQGWRHGSVGPMYRAVLSATVKLIAIAIFLVSVWFSTVRLVENASLDTSKISQATVVFIVGSLPLIGYVISRLVRPTSGRNDAIADTVKSILQPTVENVGGYLQAWPVNDMAFHWNRRQATTTSNESDALLNGDVLAGKQSPPTAHVDLLINVFDDDGRRDGRSRRAETADDMTDVDVDVAVDDDIGCSGPSSNCGGIVSPV